MGSVEKGDNYHSLVIITFEAKKPKADFQMSRRRRGAWVVLLVAIVSAANGQPSPNERLIQALDEARSQRKQDAIRVMALVAATNETDCEQHFEVAFNDPRLPFIYARATVPETGWFAADAANPDGTACFTTGLHDLRSLKDVSGKCLPNQSGMNQTFSNLSMFRLPDGNLAAVGYGDADLGETSVGDAIYIMWQEPDLSWRRQLKPILSFKPSPRNFWPDEGGLGTGGSVVEFSRATVAGFRYGMLVGTQGSDGEDFFSWAVSRDGKAWSFEAQNGATTDDPKQAARFIDPDISGSPRNWHHTAWRGSLGNIYLAYGQQSLAGIVMFVTRFKFDPTTPYGHRKMELEIYDNGPRRTSYTKEGTFIPFSGKMNAEQQINVGRFQGYYDYVEPHTFLPLTKPDGSPGGLVMAGHSLNGWGSPHAALRACLSDEWPFLCGPEMKLDTQELMRAFAKPHCAAGDTGLVLWQDHGKMFMGISMSEGPSGPPLGYANHTGCAAQPGGVAFAELEFLHPGATGLTSDVYEIGRRVTTIRRTSPRYPLLDPR